MLTARKAANGYRYYTEADISRFISILYQRKMDIGLDDIATLWMSTAPWIPETPVRHHPAAPE
ncbi:MAG: hypothetical protein ACLTBC_03690 [Pilosibacter sp.]